MDGDVQTDKTSSSNATVRIPDRADVGEAIRKAVRSGYETCPSEMLYEHHVVDQVILALDKMLPYGGTILDDGICAFAYTDGRKCNRSRTVHETLRIDHEYKSRVPTPAPQADLDNLRQAVEEALYNLGCNKSLRAQKLLREALHAK